MFDPYKGIAPSMLSFSVGIGELGDRGISL